MVHGVHGPLAVRPVKQGSSLAVVNAMTQCLTKMVCRVSVRPEKHEPVTKGIVQVTHLKVVTLAYIEKTCERHILVLLCALLC